MIEYLYNAIKATAGRDIELAAKVTNESGKVVNEQCHLMLMDESGDLITRATGNLIDGVWQFTIPAAVTADKQGRFWYCICGEEQNYCFKQPIYLV